MTPEGVFIILGVVLVVLGIATFPRKQEPRRRHDD